MTSSVYVCGESEDQKNWMSGNYAAVDTRFRKIHPTFRSEKGTFEGHGIKNRDDGLWDVPCHWDSGEHLRQSRRDIEKALGDLDAPEGIEVEEVPWAD